jgi:hypothetical protein
MSFTENDQKNLHPSLYSVNKKVKTMDENRVILQDLPTSVRGFVFLGDDGDPVIVVNSRLTREQNRKTWEHERKHIADGDMYESTYIEYK